MNTFSMEELLGVYMLFLPQSGTCKYILQSKRQQTVHADKNTHLFKEMGSNCSPISNVIDAVKTNNVIFLDEK